MTFQTVSTTGAFAGGYDASGNMTVRVVNGMGQVLTYDAENRLTKVQTSTSTAEFVYDGDGNRVKASIGGTSTYYLSNYFEWTSGAMKKYYYAGGERIAMCDGSTVYYLLNDHLGGTNLTVTTAGGKYGELRYKAWGETRYTWGTTPTSMRFTGQREESSLGIYFYNARYYDPMLGRFLQADSIVPDPYNPTDYDRFVYVRNNPIIYTDGSGHNPKCGPDGIWCDNDPNNDNDYLYMPDSYCPSLKVGGKTCYLVPVGNWNISTYNYAAIRDADKLHYGSNKGKVLTIQICNIGGSGCESITAPFRFWFGSEGILDAGTGILSDGRAIHVDSYDGYWVDTTYERTNGTEGIASDYFVGTATFYWGYGGPGRPLIPYYDSAVGPSFKGGTYYIPELKNYTPYNGIFYGVDSGGKITDREIDVFTGTGLVTQNYYLQGIDSTPVYELFCPD